MSARKTSHIISPAWRQPSSRRPKSAAARKNLQSPGRRLHASSDISSLCGSQRTRCASNDRRELQVTVTRATKCATGETCNFLHGVYRVTQHGAEVTIIDSFYSGPY